MTFADELRSSKGPQVPQLTKEQKAAKLNNAAAATIYMLKEKARSMNNQGKHSVSGWLANDYFLCLVEIQKKFFMIRSFWKKIIFALNHYAAIIRVVLTI